MAIAAYQDPAAQTADLRKKLADTHQDVASLRLENAMLTESTQDLGAKVRCFTQLARSHASASHLFLLHPPWQIEAHEELTAELSKLLDCKGDILPAVARVLEEVEVSKGITPQRRKMPEGIFILTCLSVVVAAVSVAAAGARSLDRCCGCSKRGTPAAR